jgi:hypothetical protein
MCARGRAHARQQQRKAGVHVTRCSDMQGCLDAMTWARVCVNGVMSLYTRAGRGAAVAGSAGVRGVAA